MIKTKKAVKKKIVKKKSRHKITQQTAITLKIEYCKTNKQCSDDADETAKDLTIGALAENKEAKELYKQGYKLDTKAYEIWGNTHLYVKDGKEMKDTSRTFIFIKSKKK